MNRVFISDDLPELMPFFLRFMTGVIDTNDLPLNVSREMLQKTPVMQKIKKGIVKRILNELKKRSEDKEDYKKFWDSFGIVFKEGLYEPIDERLEVADLCRFNQTKGDELTSFDEYVFSMKEGQENIYYLTGTNLEAFKNNPQLAGFAARGINVLLLTGPIDEFWIQTYTEHKGKKIVSVMHAGSDIEKIKLENEPTEQTLDKNKEKELINRIKETLKDCVKDVQATDRLTKSPFALITPAGVMSLNLERLMKAHGQQIAMNSDRILEINPRHEVIHKLADMLDKKEMDDKINDAILVLFDQTLIAEGEPLKDPAAFSRRLTSFVLSGLA